MAYKYSKSKDFSEKYKDMEKSSQAFMSEINRQKTEQKKQGGSTSGNVGEYTEAPGGGTPKQDGGGRGAMNKEFVVADSPDDPKAKAAKAKGEAVRYNQPRTEDGQFTYNSANAKGLSTKKSRGKTKPPFLKGVDLTFFEEGAVFKLDDTNLTRMMAAVTLTPSEIVEACKVYLKDERGFAGIVGTMITKKGRTAKSEKTGAGAAREGKVGKVDTSKLAPSTQQQIQKIKNTKSNPNYTYTPKKKNVKVNVSSFATKTPTSKEPVMSGTSTNVGKQEEPKVVKENYLTKDWSSANVNENPHQFVKDNIDLIKQMKEMVPGMKTGKALKIISSGKVKNFEHFKKIVQKHNEKNKNV